MRLAGGGEGTGEDFRSEDSGNKDSGSRDGGVTGGVAEFSKRGAWDAAEEADRVMQCSLAGGDLDLMALMTLSTSCSWSAKGGGGGKNRLQDRVAS